MSEHRLRKHMSELTALAREQMAGKIN